MAKHRYLSLLAGLFTANLVITNILNTKLFDFFGFVFPAGIVTFPLSFLAADVLTEVYGYRVTRQIIWSGFIALLVMAAAAIAAIHLPAASFWNLQDSFQAVLQQVPRIVVASILAYWGGEFCNSYVLARSKVATEGRGMWLRFVTSTMAGQAVDTLVFMTVAFAGVYPASDMVRLFVSSWLFKVIWEILALPISVPFTRWLKVVESEDYFDRDTNFTPFRIAVDERHGD